MMAEPYDQIANPPVIDAAVRFGNVIERRIVANIFCDRLLKIESRDPEGSNYYVRTNADSGGRVAAVEVSVLIMNVRVNLAIELSDNNTLDRCEVNRSDLGGSRSHWKR